MTYSLKPKKRDDEPQDDWLLTFSDMATLLLCFFVILFALTSAPTEHLSKFSEALKKAGFSTSEVREDPFETLIEALDVSVGASGYDQFLVINKTDGEVSIEMASSGFFAAGSAQFKPDALPMLEMVAVKLKPFMQANVKIHVTGHTDDVPIATAQYPSNWELSSARASNVVRFLIASGLTPNKMVAEGVADTQPKAENRDATGTPIPANQELNRRVVVTLSRN